MVSINTRSNTHLVWATLRSSFLGRHGPLVLMGNTEHARPHKGVLSAARMLDLCRVSALLCAP